ncbi:hypothetical protein BT96DRAFT_927802 [Gymnopus androsaceus JB14]|uniref:Uncharacterized protein n=1 Tax=Gymnopus androsaceus JB14 TaxID=1447944 RepID=A0A6A4GN91_9AGAR|nr:hypothetical protein BT96DRAFT_927802 [Gymnopus androsaceus JB14]
MSTISTSASSYSKDDPIQVWLAATEPCRNNIRQHLPPNPTDDDIREMCRFLADSVGGIDVAISNVKSISTGPGDSGDFGGVSHLLVSRRITRLTILVASLCFTTPWFPTAAQSQSCMDPTPTIFTGAYMSLVEGLNVNTASALTRAMSKLEYIYRRCKHGTA